MLLYSLDYSHKGLYDYEMLGGYLEEAGFASNKIFQCSAGFSYSEVMAKEAPDQHIEISLIVEAIK